MKKVAGSFFVLVFLFGVWVIPALAADPSVEIEQLKGEVNKLLQRIQDLEKKQAETETKAKEAEKKITEVETKAVKVEKKSLKDRIELGGEARFRYMYEVADTEAGFYGMGNPEKNFENKDESSFPTRIRLNAHVEVVPDILDFYSRLTINKRWGAYDTSATDPFNKPNSFESSIGHDLTPRFEQFYMTMKLPFDTTWYVGRLPGLDGPPSRQARSLFPRLFIDSEIDGTLLKWDAPKTALDDIELPWAKPLWGGSGSSAAGDKPDGPERTFATLEAYNRKVQERSGIILGYLKYDERKISLPNDADVFLGQGELKVGKDTAIILDALYMDDWHMPRTSFGSDQSVSFKWDPTNPYNAIYVTIPDLKTPYSLLGGYLDTQLFGLQIYGAYYYSHFSIPTHTVQYHNRDWKTFTAATLPPGIADLPHSTVGGSTTYWKTFEEKGFPGHIWYIGFNTGDLISRDMQFCLEYAKGSDAWINPFNYRGYRRKGTVSQPANNYYYFPVNIPSPSDTSNTGGVKDMIVGFYPFNAGVWDAYYDYYFRKNVRFRLGMMDFIYTKHDSNVDDTDLSILGSSKFEHDWWPYAEINITF